MPIFDYKCKKCGKKVELIVLSSSEKGELKCPHCGSADIEKMFSSFNVGGPRDAGGSSGSSCPTGTCPL